MFKRILSFSLAVFMLMSTLPSSGESEDVMIEMACVSECCFGSIDESQNTCSEEESGDEEEGCCTDGLCNPFVTCKVCLGYLASEFEQSFAVLTEKKNRFTLVNDRISGAYISDCWQPPELV